MGNTSFQSAAGMTPFEAVYGRTPPTLKKFLLGEVKVHVVAEELRFKSARRDTEAAAQEFGTCATKSEGHS